MRVVIKNAMKISARFTVSALARIHYLEIELDSDTCCSTIVSNPNSGHKLTTLRNRRGSSYSHGSYAEQGNLLGVAFIYHTNGMKIPESDRIYGCSAEL